MNERKESDFLFAQNIIRWKNDLVLSALELIDKKKLSEISKETLAYRKTNFLKTVQSEIRTVFEIMTDEEKEKIWEIIKDDMPCLLNLVETNRGDAFPEKALNNAVLQKILSSGRTSIMPNFVHSQSYRKGMRKFLISEKYRQLIMDKIGTTNYLKLMEEISQDKKLAKRS